LKKKREGEGAKGSWLVRMQNFKATKGADQGRGAEGPQAESQEGREKLRKNLKAVNTRKEMEGGKKVRLLRNRKKKTTMKKKMGSDHR